MFGIPTRLADAIRSLGVEYLVVSCDNYIMKVSLCVSLLIKYQVVEN